MRPVVVTAFLLLVCILDPSTCNRYKDSPCSDGWHRIDENRCVKFFKSPKTFHEAQEHCRTLNSDLASVNSHDTMLQLLCLTIRVDSHAPKFWIGTTTSEEGFRNTDGSKFMYIGWYHGQPNTSHGQTYCTELNINSWGAQSAAHCSDKNFFVCAKKM